MYFGEVVLQKKGERREKILPKPEALRVIDLRK
jgi:hypothetical protein